MLALVHCVFPWWSLPRSKWLRREIRSLFESIIAIWNAEHVVFELSLVEDRPYALRLTKKAIY
jgi:hypothetical protein